MTEIYVAGLPNPVTVIPRPPEVNPALVYLASLGSRSGRITQASALKIIAGWIGGNLETVDWGNLRYQHAIAIKSKIVSSYAPSTSRKMMCALRGTFKASWKLGYMTAEELAKVSDTGKIIGKSLPSGRYILDEEVSRLFAVCASDPSAMGRRDAALIALLYGCGLRREEAVTLTTEDYNQADGTLRVHGKRGKERTAYIHNGIKDALDAWMFVRTWEPGALLLAIKSNGLPRRDHAITPQAVYLIVKGRIAEAGLQDFSPHSLRRSFCSRLLDAGVDLSTVSKLAGHENVQTTMIYDRRSDTTQRDGAANLHIPYIPPIDRSEGENHENAPEIRQETETPVPAS